MPDIVFSFDGHNGVSAWFAYSRAPNESGRLSLRFSFEKIGESHIPKIYSLRFNAIGKGDPLAFLESLDQGYLTDKVNGLSSWKEDLFTTIQAVRRAAAEADLSPAEIAVVEERIEEAAIAFEGDHRSSCQALIDALRRSDIACFQDDAYHLVGRVRTSENINFEKEVWPAVLMALEDFIVSNPEIDSRIAYIVKGLETPLSKDGPGF